MQIINDKKTFFEVVEYLSRQERLGHDTETLNALHGNISALYPFHGGRSFSHIFATKEDEFYFDFNVGGLSPTLKKELQPIFNCPKRIIYYCNAIYDNCIMHFDGLKNYSRIVDLPAIARVDYNLLGKSFDDESFLSLDYLAQNYLKKLKSDKVKYYINEHNLYAPEKCIISGERIPLFHSVPLGITAPYACLDARLTFDTGSAILRSINAKDIAFTNHRGNRPKMIDIARQEIKLTSVLIKMKIDGLKVDKEYCNLAIAHEQKVIEDANAIIERELGHINYNSGAQLAAFLIEKGVSVPRGKPTTGMLERAEKLEKNASGKNKDKMLAKAREYRAGNFKTDKATLEILGEKYQIPALLKITESKKAQKKIATYYSNFLKLADSKHIIHPNLLQFTAKSGRFSSIEPNLQNLHKEKWNFEQPEFLIRRAFAAPLEDEELFFFDYSQQEMIFMLDQAGARAVIEKLLSGEYKDFYLATKAVIFEMTRKELTRHQAKQVSLGLAYGQGIDLLAYNLKCFRDEARETKAAYFKGVPELADLDKKLKEQAKYTGKIHLPTGRVSYLPQGKDHACLNYYVQGSCADIIKACIVEIAEYLKVNKLNSRIALTVHDEIIMRIKTNERFIVPEIVRIMSNIYKPNSIGLSVEVEYAPRNARGLSVWGEKVAYAV